jgi:hypothetical protein
MGMEGDIFGSLMRWQVSVWIIGALAGALFLVLRAALARFTQQMDERLARIERVTEEIARIDGELARLRAELPVHYIRRDDHIRDITTLSVKLDRIYELLLIKGVRHD